MASETSAAFNSGVNVLPLWGQDWAKARCGWMPSRGGMSESGAT